MPEITAPAPTRAELASLLLASDNLLRDIRLAINGGIDAERRSYHLSQISTVTARNHLVLCQSCRDREIAAGHYTPATEPASPDAPYAAPAKTPVQNMIAAAAALKAEREPRPGILGMAEIPATPWPLGINPNMDDHAQALGLSHWSCWSVSDNSLWARMDGRMFRYTDRGRTYPEELRLIDSLHPMGAPARIVRCRAGGIRIEKPSEIPDKGSEGSQPASPGFQPGAAAAAAADPAIELTGTNATLSTIIDLGCGPDGTALPALRGSKVVRLAADIGPPHALRLTLPGARHLWRVCTAEMADIVRRILFDGNPQPGDTARFAALTKARRLLDAAFGASLPPADQRKMDALMTNLTAA